MTKEEIIALAEELIAKANDLLDSVNAENEQEGDVLADYKEALKHGIYWVGSSNDIGYDKGGFDLDGLYGLEWYSNYPSEEFAKQAKKLKDFNDKLLAFKWCYDRDYTPNWDDVTDKFYVYYDLDHNKYYAGHVKTMHENLIYFSSIKIAQKCCDWLNSNEWNNTII